MLYRILKLIVGIGITFYYKKVVRKNTHYLKHDGPMIIIANHPNTLMDAWIIGHICQQPIHYMAKGTLFNSKFKLWLLQSLNMIPINRSGESKAKGVSNADSFEACYKILEEGKTLVIFPEGTSFQERILRELKSGTARIALEAERRNAGKLNLLVVPVGLNYLKAEKFRSSVFVHVGRPIQVSNYLLNDEKMVGIQAKKLTEQFRIELESVLANASTKEEELFIHHILEIIQSKYYKEEFKSIEGEIELFRIIRDNLQAFNLTQPWLIQEISELVENIRWNVRKLNIKTDFLDRKFRSRMFFRQMLFSILFLLIGLPIFIIGLIHNYLQYKLTDKLIPKLTKDVEYYAPLAVLIGLFLYPLVYGLFVVGANQLFGLVFWEKLVYFSIMPLSGLFAYFFHRYMAHINYKWKYIFLMFNDREAMKELQEKRNKLRAYFSL